MDPGVCLECKGKVHGHVMDIPLTLYCKKCVHSVARLKTRLSARHWGSTARPTLKRPDLLGALHFAIEQRLYGGGSYSYERRYLGIEVTSVSKLPLERVSAEIRLKQSEIDEKKALLEKDNGVCLDGLDPFVNFFLLGDYLSGACNAKTKHQEVMQRCRVLPGVLDILKIYKTAHPETVFQFCLQYPTADPSEFQELRDKMRLVFHLQGFRILDKLRIYDLLLLKCTGLRDVVEEYRRRDRVGCVRSYLEPLVGLTDAENITKDSVCLEYIHGLGSLSRKDRDRAEKLAEFWKERADPDEKKSRLVTALASKKLSLPEGNFYCDGYINNTMVILLDEIVHFLQGNIWDIEHEYSDCNYVSCLDRWEFPGSHFCYDDYDSERKFNSSLRYDSFYHYYD